MLCPVFARRRDQFVISGLQALDVAEVRAVSWFFGLVLASVVDSDMPPLETLGHMLMVPIEPLEVCEGVLRDVSRV